ncbi:MAG: hypothetical protein NZ740_01310 [Kiritimatiellae bacterium]|nr:hypothetical protein [Kiritimatiellia bacterium]MDW8457729.1 hypothetical protein [Verrucomicrobiota bacterium]
MLSIQPTTGVARAATGFHPAAGERLTRFLEDGVEVPAAVLEVTWEQSPGLAPAGAALQLEYRLSGDPRVRTIRRTLPARERGPRTERFEMPLTPAGGMRVTAWRLRVVAGERVLEEITSAGWR